MLRGMPPFCFVRRACTIYRALMPGVTRATAQNPPPATPAIREARAASWLAVTAIGLLQVWAHRNDLSPDGISYIELARASLAQGLPALTNAYWSPLYPFLIRTTFRLVNPSIAHEFTSVHLLNFFIYLASFACFSMFRRELHFAHDAPKQHERFSQISPCMLAILANVFFLWAGQFWLSPSLVNPDLCVAALVYLASAILFRVWRTGGTWGLWLSLGVVLGLGYLAKAAMFLVAFVFLFSAFFLARRANPGGAKPRSFRAIGKTLLAGAIFLVIAAPWINAISRAKHRWSFGDSGKIAYAEYIDSATLSTHWQGMPPGTGIPLHPTRKILSDPPMYEFAQPIPGSYPPWYDPSYWYDGIHPHFAIRGQLWVLFRSLNLYFKMFSKTGALYVVVFALLWGLKRCGRWQPVSPGMWLVMLPSFAALAMYALVLVEYRYVSPFVLMLLIWTFSRIEIAGDADPKYLRRASLVVVLAPIVAIAWPVIHDARDTIRNRPYEDWQVAMGLRDFGVLPGAALGYIGSGGDAYWAHLAGDRIIAEIPGRDQSRFTSADAEKRLAILQTFVAAGAQAVVTKNASVVTSMPGDWRRIRDTQYYTWRP